MTIEEFTKMICHTLIIKLVDDEYVCYIENAQVKIDNILFNLLGEGSTPQEAKNDYIVKISGRLLVFNPEDRDRMNIPVPKNLN